jgi:phosphoribosyl 1,2-cyclic phosphate phosphodiesterase
MKVTILGCGTAGGVPRIGNVWGNCDPNNPRNRRRRASILVQSAETSILVDTSPDLRSQAIDAEITRLDAVLFTHDHADHAHGIDDLRYVVRLMREKIDVYGDARTLDALNTRFGYVFAEDPAKLYPPILSAHVIDGRFTVGGVEITSFRQDHGPIDTLGFRFGDIAYSTDVVNLDEAAFEALAGVDTWIVDSLMMEPHPTHAHLERTLEWIERVRPRRAVLTHLNVTMDYETVMAATPDHVEVAYDGMVLEV